MRVLDFRDLHEVKGIRWSRPTLNKKIEKDDFPRPFPISERRHVWLEAAVDEWLAAKAKEAEDREK